MTKLSKFDQQAKISATEAERCRKVAMAQIREMERDQKRGSLLPRPKSARYGPNAWAR